MMSVNAGPRVIGGKGATVREVLGKGANVGKGVVESSVGTAVGMGAIVGVGEAVTVAGDG